MVARGTLTFDIETHSADLLYTMPPEEFVRLIGYRWKGQRDVVLTTDLEEIRAQIMRARWIIGHNINSFDLPAAFGSDSDIPVWLAHRGRVFDTWTHAALVNPAPFLYTDRKGKLCKVDSPEKAKHWFGLDEQAFQLGVKGKTDDLKELAFEFGDPDLPRKDRITDGFGKIPVEDPRYRGYLKGDVVASETVSRALLRKGPLDAYALREQEIEARKAVISANGIRVFQDRAQARVDELAARRAVIMSGLVERYDFPTDGSAPWATDRGQRSILQALADSGVTPDTVDWPKTPRWAKRGEALAEAESKRKELLDQVAGYRSELINSDLSTRTRGTRERWIARDEARAAEIAAEPLPPYFGLSMGGEELIALTAGTAAEDLGRALAELKGQRSLAQLALDSMHADGFCHPQISMLQKSGRWSTTDPGLTIWTAHGPGAVEKSYFGPDTDDEVLLEIDYSNADARGVAAMSGDRRYAERFEPGQDGHLINAWAAWGKDKVGTDRSNPVTEAYRDKAKPLGHGKSYGGGWKTLARESGVPEADAKTFCEGFDKAFYVLCQWQDAARKFARQHGHVVNEWGRKMPVEQDRIYTQAPALLGQSWTREIVCDALLRMPMKALRRVKAQVHDALLFSVPRKDFERWCSYLCDLMTTRFQPRTGGLAIDVPVQAGPPGADWYLAGHGG